MSFSVLVFLIYHPNMDSFFDLIMRPSKYIFYMVFFKLFILCLQALISMAFQQKLTENLHECYLSNRVYYVASTLRGLSNADQVSFVLKTLGCVWWSYLKVKLKGAILLGWELGWAYVVLASIWPIKLSSVLISNCFHLPMICCSVLLKMYKNSLLPSASFSLTRSSLCWILSCLRALLPGL